MSTIGNNSLLQPATDWRNTAILGWHEDDSALAMGFLEAADVLVREWSARRPNDLLALPILQNYRHGIELALKASIHAAAQCLRNDCHTDADLQPDALDEQLSKTHSVGQLAQRLTDMLARLHLGAGQEIPAEVRSALGALHALDETGQWLRYSTVKTGKGKNRRLVPARPDQIHFDLPAAAQALHDAGGIVLHGVSGVLGQYAEWQRDRAEVQREYDDEMRRAHGDVEDW